MDVQALKQEQFNLAKRVITDDKFERDELIGGCDLGFIGNKAIAVMIIFKGMDIVEKKYTLKMVDFPYIPGYLSYRELPALIKVYSKLEVKPDILMCDFNGILHPRFVGAASHLGLELDICTIGVAKSLLCGEVRGDYVFIGDRKVAYKFGTKYISPGHKISLESSVRIVKRYVKYSNPEPTRLAHNYAKELKSFCK